MSEKTAILKKMVAVMKEVGYIKKDARNTFQKYTYASERIIKEKVREALLKHGVVFSFSVSSPEILTGGLISVVQINYAFVDADTGESIGGQFVGSGHARDEKAIYAAITGAIKYCLTSNLLIATGDDPEDDAHERAPQKTVDALVNRVTKAERLVYDAAPAIKNARTKYVGTNALNEADPEKLEAYLKHMKNKFNETKETSE